MKGSGQETRGDDGRVDDEGGWGKNWGTEWAQIKSILNQAKTIRVHEASQEKKERIAGRDDVRKKAVGITKTRRKKEECRAERESKSTFIACVNRGVVGADE